MTRARSEVYREEMPPIMKISRPVAARIREEYR